MTQTVLCKLKWITERIYTRCYHASPQTYSMQNKEEIPEISCTNFPYYSFYFHFTLQFIWNHSSLLLLYNGSEFCVVFVEHGRCSYIFNRNTWNYCSFFLVTSQSHLKSQYICNFLHIFLFIILGILHCALHRRWHLVSLLIKVCKLLKIISTVILIC